MQPASPPSPPTGSQGLGGVGCAWKRGIGKTAPLLLPLPLSPSRAPVRRCARTPGNLAQAAPPLRGAQAPPPRCRRCPPVSGCPASGNARSWGDRVGSASEKLLESLASPEPALGVRLKDCRESAQAGRYCFSLDSGPPGWGRGGTTHWKSVHLGAVVGMQPPLSTLAVSGVVDESSLGGLYTHHDGDAIADGGEWFVFISPVAFCLLGTACWPC